MWSNSLAESPHLFLTRESQVTEKIIIKWSLDPTFSTRQLQLTSLARSLVDVNKFYCATNESLPVVNSLNVFIDFFLPYGAS